MIIYSFSTATKSLSFFKSGEYFQSRHGSLSSTRWVRGNARKKTLFFRVRCSLTYIFTLYILYSMIWNPYIYSIYSHPLYSNILMVAAALARPHITSKPHNTSLACIHEKRPPMVEAKIQIGKRKHHSLEEVSSRRKNK